MSFHSYTTPKALQEMASIMDFLRKANSGTARQIAEAVGLLASSVNDYLQHMRCDELVRTHETMRGSNGARVWIIGTDPAVLADLRPKVIIKKEWTPNHVRMALDCYLFGVPAVMQGVA